MADGDFGPDKRPDDVVFDYLIARVKQWMDDPQKRREFEQWQEERWAEWERRSLSRT